MEHEVRRDDDRQRYELYVDGALVGVADFELAGDVVVLPHTAIEPARRGRGLGAVLVRGALADIRPTGRKVVPRCWYVRDYFDAHPEESDLLA